VTGDTYKVTKVTEDGYEVWDIDKPCALTVVKEANQLRMPSLKKKMAAKKAEIPCWGFEELQPDEEKIGLAGSPTKVSKVFAPPVKLNKEILSGEPSEMVTELIKKLKEQNIL
jgi:electron transfer flavoprotein beta subunit